MIWYTVKAEVSASTEEKEEDQAYPTNVKERVCSKVYKMED